MTDYGSGIVGVSGMTRHQTQRIQVKIKGLVSMVV